MKLELISQKSDKNIPTTHLLKTADELEQLNYSPALRSYVRSKFSDEANAVFTQVEGQQVGFVLPAQEEEQYSIREAFRIAGYQFYQSFKQDQPSQVRIEADKDLQQAALDFAEGLALSAYSFDKYKKEKAAFLSTIQIYCAGLERGQVEELQKVVEAVYQARHWVNEPLSHLTAVRYAEELKVAGEKVGLTVTILDKTKIEELGMGGLLAVNKGSLDPPSFTILEHRPEHALNDKPVVLVGKGVVYDTGGLSLKPTANSMDIMKCDMGGSAAVAGATLAAAANNLPIHLVTLIPATDNRPSGNAYAPGDVITMYDGTTVEVKNTDAEGRLLLADALAYAKKLEPEFVFDAATLTGAAMRAIGSEGAVIMGTAHEDIRARLTHAGEATYERAVWFPLWKEYESHLKSSIADIKNLGKATAGAISAALSSSILQIIPGCIMI